jgi:hypothetical protein
VKNETDVTIGRFFEIRRVAQFIDRESDWDILSIDALCWLALERLGTAPGHQWQYSEDYAKKSPNKHLLSAAAHFNLVPLVHRLLAEGCCPISHEFLFPPAMELAAWAGNTPIVEIFQEHLPEIEENNDPGCKWCWYWRGKVCPDAIVGASIRGDLDILELTVYPPSRAMSDNTNILGQPRG